MVNGTGKQNQIANGWEGHGDKAHHHQRDRGQKKRDLCLSCQTQRIHSQRRPDLQKKKSFVDVCVLPRGISIDGDWVEPVENFAERPNHVVGGGGVKSVENSV